MATVKQEQYLTSVIDATTSDSNEIRLSPGSNDFDLFTINLENHNGGVHRYQTTGLTILYEAVGTTKTKINGQAFTISAGNIILLQKKSEYEVEKQGKKDLLVKIELSQRLSEQFTLKKKQYFSEQEKAVIDHISKLMTTNRLLNLNCSAMSRSAQIMKKIIDEYLNQDLFVENMVLAELSILFVAALRNKDFEKAPTAAPKFAQTALEQYIDENFADVTLNEAAKHFGLNPNYFSTLVKQKTGKSFVEHVDERRMQEARSLLARPDISVKEVITRVGYNGKSFFYKKFGEYYHETPVQMRAELFRQANINLK